ncbi:MAG: UbiA family prenyltransferase, partial [Pseudomonadota bacterium]
SAFALPFWLGEGKAGFKRRVAEAACPDIETLPLNSAVLDEIDAARTAGRRVVLATASDQIYADAVGRHLELFDEVHGSDGTRNLGGAEKAAFLEDRFGRAGYDYIGDSAVDLPVWAAGREGIVVDGGHAPSAEAPGGVREIADTPREATALLRALRPHQWLKNALIAVPMLTAYQFDLMTLGLVAMAIMAFSLTASGVYIINDLLDLASDRRHPRKSRRPFAAGEVSVATGVATAFGLWIGAFLVAILTLPGPFLLVLGIYFAATFAYSLFLKKRAVMDICTLAGLYCMRIVAGGAATGIVISPWLLAFSMFFFLALAAIKRQAEMTDLAHTDPGRETGRPYDVDDLPIIRNIAMSGGYAAVLVMALYINSKTAVARFPLPEALWLICPLLLYWMTRLVMVTHRRRMTDDPIVFALRDFVSWAVGIGIVAAAVVARVGL